MEPIDAFRDLLLSLAGIYSKEGREGGDAIAEAYRSGIETAKPTPCPRYDAMEIAILSATERATQRAAIAARQAHSVLPWSRTGILDEQISEEVSSVFAVVTLVGPGAIIDREDVRGGLYVQRSAAFYPPHAHDAEETYVMLAGTADWQMDFGDWHRADPGDLIHHPSEAPHATRTSALPILAAWRWSGDISPASYRMVTKG